jgi:hypothetical protein
MYFKNPKIKAGQNIFKNLLLNGNYTFETKKNVLGVLVRKLTLTYTLDHGKIKNGTSIALQKKAFGHKKKLNFMLRFKIGNLRIANMALLNRCIEWEVIEPQC